MSKSQQRHGNKDGLNDSRSREKSEIKANDWLIDHVLNVHWMEGCLDDTKQKQADSSFHLGVTLMMRSQVCARYALSRYVSYKSNFTV